MCLSAQNLFLVRSWIPPSQYGRRRYQVSPAYAHIRGAAAKFAYHATLKATGQNILGLNPDQFFLSYF